MENNSLSIIKEYIDKQNIRVIEKYNFEQNKIKYCCIKQHREITKSGDEEIVRAFLLTKLVNELGYESKNIEIEKEYDIGRPKKTKPRIDIIVKDVEGNSFLYIETKGPNEFEKDQDDRIENQLFSMASQEIGRGKKVKYLVLYSFDVNENEIKDKCLVIDYEKFPSFDSWKDVRDFSDSIPKHYGKAEKEPYIKGKKDLTTSFTNDEIHNLQKNLHNVLWGGGGTDDNDIFSSLVKIILAKIQDETEKSIGEKYDFQVFESKTGESFETNQTLFERINKLYRRALIEKLNMSEDEVKEEFVVEKNKFPLKKLKFTVSKLEKFGFVGGKNSLTGKDILGDFFEGIIRDGFKQSKGQFFTPINIVRFLLWGLQTDKLAISKINSQKELPFIIDPSAGSGTFLIEYMKFITKNIKYRFKSKIGTSQAIKDKFNRWFFPDNQENIWAKDFIYGIEHNFNLGTATKVNMILHGDGSTNIFIKDGLLPFNYYNDKLKNNEEDNVYKKSINGKFDLIVTNPPFSVDLDSDTKRTLKTSFEFGDKKNSENLFIERWYQLLKENGRLGAVLPESVFDTTENKYIRLFIYKFFKVKAVVSLPQLTFEPFTSTKTSLLFAQKKTKQEIKKWNELWIKFSNEWSNLKTRCENLLFVYDGEKERSKLPSIKNLTEAEEKEVLQKMLKYYLEESDKNLNPKDIINKFKNELIELCKYDNDTKDSFGFVNTWWVFGEVAKELNYKIFMAEVENIGYKRTKRGEKPAKNELFRKNEKGDILIDDGIKETALDYLRGISWD